MTLVLNFRDLRIAVRATKASEVKGLLVALGAMGQEYSGNDNRDWHVIITDKDHLAEIPDTLTRIVMTDDVQDSVTSDLITIPETLSLITLHQSLTQVAESKGVGGLEFY